MNFHSGKEAGTTFEKLFERQCQLAGMWPDPNHIKARRGWNGRLQELHSNLDYTLIWDGRVGFFDCKTYDGEFVYFSQLTVHQISLSARYNEHGVPSGFVIWFREPNKVVFYSGAWVAATMAPKARIMPGNGVLLGNWGRFDPRLIMDPSRIFRVPMGSPSGILA